MFWAPVLLLKVEPSTVASTAATVPPSRMPRIVRMIVVLT